MIPLFHSKSMLTKALIKSFSYKKEFERIKQITDYILSKGDLNEGT